MFMRVFASATTLMWLQVCGAQAGGQHGVRQRMSCSEVRYYVAKYSIATAERCMHVVRALRTPRSTPRAAA